MPQSSAEKSARYRAKDVEAYRKRKAELARSPEHRAKRTAYMRAYRAAHRAKMNEQARLSHARSRARRAAAKEATA